MGPPSSDAVRFDRNYHSNLPASQTWQRLKLKILTFVL